MVGVGAADTVSDRLQVHLAAEARAESVGVAFAAADSALAAMLAALRDHGVADDDLRSSEIEVHPDYGKDGQRAGFRASMGVTAALRDLPRAGEVLGVVLEAGGDASRVHGVTLTATGTDETTAAARDAAWADATARAGQYAALAGRNLGSVLRISELGYPDASPQVSSARTASLTAQVEPGTQTIRAAVAVRWELV